MIVAVYDHRGMAQPFIRALTAAGHAVVRADQQLDAEADALLIDLDHDNYRAMIEAHRKVFLISHGGGPVVSPVTHDQVRGAFVAGPGNVTLCEAPVVVDVGWAWCDLRPFRPSPEPRRILLAPVHPDNDGQVEARWRAQEAAARDTVINAVGHAVTLTYRPGPSTIGDTARDLAADRPDLIVAAPGTIVAVAVALGIPTITYGQHIDAFDFPYDTRGGAAAVQAACTVEPAGWRARWLGDAFDPDAWVDLFVEAVETW